MIALADNTHAHEVHEAFRDLSPRAFGFWIRLHLLETAVLRRGVYGLAKALDVPERTCERALKELRNKAYIRLVYAARPNQATQIVLVRRAMIPTPSRFVKL